MQKKALVIGFGISGKSAAKVLMQKGFSVIAADRKTDQDHQGIDLVSDASDIDLRGVELAILSPGIPKNHPLVQKVTAQGIECIGEIDLAFRYVKNRCVAITGSNGKTTTTLLTAHLLNQAGQKARAVGNVGQSMTSCLSQADPDEVWVVELSSFQLEDLKEARFEAAVILNITPNHLDRHASMEEYANAKGRIRLFAKKLAVSEILLKSWALGWNAERFDLGNIENLRYGLLETQNVLAAKWLCAQLGYTDVEKHISTFVRPPHRLEWAGEKRGVSCYNDSKSTSVDATLHALKAFKSQVVLIVGGKDKGASYTPWIEACKGKVSRVVAYGQAAQKIEEQIGSQVELRRIESFEEAVFSALSQAKENEIVLLSPGCSSYDQFSGFEQRGEAFQRMVRSWIEKEQS